MNIAAREQIGMTIEVRNEREQDAAAIQQVHVAAFGGSAEAKLVRLISERKKALISLVAVSKDSVVGHILFSRVTIDNAPAGFNSVGLAPLAVSPKFQRRGIGSKLIREGLERCNQASYDAVVVLGDPVYYSRFGFVLTVDFGLENEYGAYDEFMVLALRDRALEAVSGVVKYLPEFREAEC